MIEMLVGLVKSGRIAEIALMFIAVEAIARVLVARRTQRIMPWAALAHLVAGACLMLALRGALVGAGEVVILAWLTGALLAHVIDSTLRLTR